MWLITSIGFYSIVQKPGDNDLTVRARVASDLDALREHCPTLGPTITHAGTDYPFRAKVTHAAWADCVAKLAHLITYANFKDEVAKQQGYQRASVYSRVWSALFGLEQRTP